MEQSDEHLVDKKIAEAKLEVAEKRLQITIWSVGILLTIMAAVFGMIIPMISANRNSDKVDKEVMRMQDEVKEMRRSIENVSAKNDTNFSRIKTEVTGSAKKATHEMKTEVQEFLGKKLTRPEVTLLYDGEEINGKSINITEVENWYFKFVLQNKGNATARDVKLVLYQKENSKIEVQTEIPWQTRGISEEKGYTRSYNYNGIASSLGVIDPQYPATLEAGIYIPQEILEAKEDLLIKIFYGQPEPTKVFFTVEKKTAKN